VRVDDHDPQKEQRASHDSAHDLDSGTVQAVADLDGCDGEANVGENVRVPIEMEIVAVDGFKCGNGSDSEEESSQHPEEDGSQERTDLKDVVDHVLVPDTREGGVG